MPTPWDIGSAHWNQRDLYTTNASVEDDGYGAGPPLHPEIGAFAYRRDIVPARAPIPPPRELWAREAWPWRTDEPERPRSPRRQHEGALVRLVDRVVSALVGRTPEARLADELLAADVRGALALHRDVDVDDIYVDALDCRVTLQGTVPDAAMKSRAVEVARAAPGVRRVHDKLKVRHDDDVLFQMPLRVVT
jgi:hypothetical protein